MDDFLKFFMINYIKYVTIKMLRINCKKWLRCKGGERQMKRISRITSLLIVFLIILFIFGLQIPSNEASGEGKLVYIIPVEKEVERGLEAFLKRTIEEAEEAGANHIIFEIDTPGGRVDSATQIAKLLQTIEMPTTAYIVNEALSAGSYIALNLDSIYMQPNATMGASAVITTDGTMADEKAQSAWIAMMKSAAESKGRDPIYAIAMADPTVDLPEYGAPKDKLLTLTPTEAEEVGYAEGIVQNRTELLHALDLQGAELVEPKTSFAEELARFVTSPIVIPILLSIASIGLIVELYTPGFGIAGTMGLIALLLFFYGHIIAGLAGLEAISLLVIGIILVVLEFFVPGGILGIIGASAIVVSLFLAGYDLSHMAISILVALILGIVTFIILYRSVDREKGLFKKIILQDRTTTDEGYISATTRFDLIGQIGRSVTPLRPAGTIIVNNERIDAVSEGNYINNDVEVEIIHVEGMRVVVQEVKDKNKEEM